MILKLGVENNEQELTAFGRTFIVDDNIIYKEQRTISGKLLRDIIAIKKQFTVKYSLLENSVINYLLYLQQLNAVLSFIVDINGSVTKYYVVMDSFSRTRELITETTTYWSDVTLTLKEV